MSPHKALRLWLRALASEHLAEHHGQLKSTVRRRLARQASAHILGHWLTAWDPVHLNGMRAAMQGEAWLRRFGGALVAVACERILHGHVLAVQRVLALIDDAHAAALGRCVCRAAKITADLHGPDGRVYLVGDAAAHATCWEGIAAARAQEPNETEPALVAAIDQATQETTWNASQRLEYLWQQSYPMWEILLVHRDYTRAWNDNLRRQRKAWPVARPLLKALVSAHYVSRGAIFTGMELFEQPYAICTCPGPENDRGCSLVHWHYFSDNPHALYANTDDFHGQARLPDGTVAPCQRFAARHHRPCLGCGCQHDRP